LARQGQVRHKISCSTSTSMASLVLRTQELVGKFEVKNTIIAFRDLIQSHLQFSDSRDHSLLVRPRRQQQVSIMESRNTGRQNAMTGKRGYTNRIIEPSQPIQERDVSYNSDKLSVCQVLEGLRNRPTNPRKVCRLG